MAFESDFVVCRLGSAQDLAETFARWQSVISTPNLDRKFATTLTVTPVGIVIAGTISFAVLLVKSQLLIYLLPRYLLRYSCRIQCPQHWSSIGFWIFDQSWYYEDWLGSVLNWAEGEIFQVVGGVVSLQLQAKLYLLWAHLIYLDSPPLSTWRV